jgi:hypothetical protein
VVVFVITILFVLDPDIPKDITSLELMDLVIDRLAERGILVLLDFVCSAHFLSFTYPFIPFLSSAFCSIPLTAQALHLFGMVPLRIQRAHILMFGKRWQQGRRIDSSN